MTSSEDMLRDVLDDLAPGAPADGSAYAGIGRAITRRRRRRAAARVAGVAALALAALGTAALVSNREPTARVDTEPDADVAPGPDGATDPSPDPADDGGPTTQNLDGITFELPPGWTATEQQGAWLDVDANEEHPYTSLCLVGTAAPTVDGCTLEVFHGDVPGDGGFEAYNPEGASSWWHATDVMVCPTGSGNNNNDTVVAANGNQSPVVRTDEVGGRDAIHSRWDVECSLSGFAFSPQGWYLPDEDLLILDILGQPETQAILDSFTFPDDEAG